MIKKDEKERKIKQSQYKKNIYDLAYNHDSEEYYHKNRFES